MAAKLPTAGGTAETLEAGAGFLQKIGRDARFKTAANVADDIPGLIQANKSSLKPPSGLDGDDAQHLRRSKNPDAPDDVWLNNPRNELPRKGKFDAVDSPGAVFDAMEPVNKFASSVGGYGFGALGVIDIVLNGAGGILGYMKFNNAKAVLQAPHTFLNPKSVIDAGGKTMGTKISDGLMGVMALTEAFDVAKGGAQHLSSLKHVYSDLTGQPVSSIGTIALLTGKVPPVMEAMRTHYVQEYLSRGAMSILGLGLNIRGMMSKKGTGLVAGFLPTFAGMGIDAVMGESVLPTYAGFANAHRKGESIPLQAYAEFIFNSSTDIKIRGPLGKEVALKLAEQYSKEKAGPGDILKEINDSILAKETKTTGKFDQRIASVITAAEAAHAVKMAEYKKVKAAKAVQGSSKDAVPKLQAPAALPTVLHDPNVQVKMVDRLNGEKSMHRPVVGDGKYTKQVRDELPPAIVTSPI